jgi:hypothetical protein
MVTCATMNSTNQHMTRKCNERATWIDRSFDSRLNRVDNAGDMPRPVIRARGPATNTVRK